MIAALKDFYVTITIFPLFKTDISEILFTSPTILVIPNGNSMQADFIIAYLLAMFAKFAVKLFWKAKNVIFQRFQFLFAHTFGDGEIGFHDFVLTWVNDRFTFFLKK